VAGAAFQRRCKIEAPCNTIFAGIEWKSHQMNRKLSDGKRFAAFKTNLAVVTHPLWSGWVAGIGTVSYASYRWEQVGKSTYSRGFPRAPTSTDENATNRWIDGVKDEGEAHVLLPNYSTQRECCHVRAFIISSSLCWVHVITYSHTTKSRNIACYHMDLLSVKRAFTSFNLFIASNIQHRQAKHSLSNGELRQKPATARLR
jgi:hypothetical protein